MLDATKVVALAVDNDIGLSMAHPHLGEALAVTAAQARLLHEAPDEAKDADCRYVAMDGTAIDPDPGVEVEVEVETSGCQECGPNSLCVFTLGRGRETLSSPG